MIPKTYRDEHYVKELEKYARHKCVMEDNDGRLIHSYDKFEEYEDIKSFLDNLIKKKDRDSSLLLTEECGHTVPVYEVKMTVSQELKEICMKCICSEAKSGVCEHEEKFSKLNIVFLVGNSRACCPEDGEFDLTFYKEKITELHDIRLRGAPSKLNISHVKYARCPKCGLYVNLPVPILDEHKDEYELRAAYKRGDMTNRLIADIKCLALCMVPVRKIAQGYGLRTHQVYDVISNTIDADKRNALKEDRRLKPPFAVESREEKKAIMYCISCLEFGRKDTYVCYSYSDTDGGDVQLKDVMGVEFRTVELWLRGDFANLSYARLSRGRLLKIAEYIVKAKYPPLLWGYAYSSAMIIIEFARLMYKAYKIGYDVYADGPENIWWTMGHLWLENLFVLLDKAMEMRDWDEYLKFLREFLAEAEWMVDAIGRVIPDNRLLVKALEAMRVRMYKHKMSHNAAALELINMQEISTQEVFTAVTRFESKLETAVFSNDVKLDEALAMLRYGNIAAVGIDTTKNNSRPKELIPTDGRGKIELRHALDGVPISCLEYLLDQGFLDKNREHQIPCAIDLFYGNCGEGIHNKPWCGREKCLRWFAEW